MVTEDFFKLEKILTDNISTDTSEVADISDNKKQRTYSTEMPKIDVI